MSRLVSLAFVLSTGCGFSLPFGDAGAGDDDGGRHDGAIDQAPMPWLDGWTHRRAVTLRAERIEAPGNTALTAFPVMLALASADLARALPDRTDLAFTADDATSRLAHELEAVDATTSTVWVKIPSLSATTDTTIYLYYGHGSPMLSTQDVWTESFRAVYHLHQDPGPGGSGEMRDATANGHHGTAEPSFTSTDSVTSPFGRAITFNGSNSCITVPALDVGARFSISAWIRLNDVSQIRTLVSNSQDGSSTNGFRFFVNSNGSSDRKVWFETGNGGQSNSVTTASNVITAEEWQHVAVIVDRMAGAATVMVDGAISATDNTIRNDFTTTLSLELGRMKNNNVFDGTLDQIEIASTARSTEWFQTAFANQRTPGDFYTVGAEEARQP